MSWYLALNLLVAIGLLVDMFRRPQSAWNLADRQRYYWAGIVVIAALFGLSLAIGLLYLILVIPRFGGIDELISPEFRK